MDFIFHIRETITFGSSANTVWKWHQLSEKKKIAVAAVREMLWKAKGQPGLRETQCVPVELSFFVWYFFSLSHPPWDCGEVGSALLPLLCVGELNRSGRFLSYSQLPVRSEHETAP